MKTYAAPVSNDNVTIDFKQSIAAERAAADGHVRQDADVHALDDDPVSVTFTLARWGSAPAREGVNVAFSVTFGRRA